MYCVHSLVRSLDQGGFILLRNVQICLELPFTQNMNLSNILKCQSK